MIFTRRLIWYLTVPFLQMALDDEIAASFLKDQTVQAKLASALTLEQVDPSNYVAVFYPGGYVTSILWR